mmetsp:Transcript_33886/g.65952  ORF Transcript_33886/g.65952 Transcript_33886/m.65952 type:complete len:136 (-) Transcript_33886:112-519(-)
MKVPQRKEERRRGRRRFHPAALKDHHQRPESKERGGEKMREAWLKTGERKHDHAIHEPGNLASPPHQNQRTGCRERQRTQTFCAAAFTFLLESVDEARDLRLCERCLSALRTVVHGQTQTLSTVHELPPHALMRC